MRVTTTAVLALALAGGAGSLHAKDWRVSYIQGVTGNPFYISVGCGAEDVAKQLGVKLDIQGAQQYQPQLQMRVLDGVIAAHPDGIMIAVTDPVALTPTLQQAKALGIKILSIDGDIKDMDVAIANVQSDNVDGGAQAAKRLAELIGDKGVVMAMMNSPAAAVSQQRLQGFTTEIAKHPGITYLGVQYSNNQTAKAAAIITSTVAAHPDLSGVFTITTNNTEGAATGVREAQAIGKIKIVGFDTSDPIVEDIRHGIVSADVVQDPYRVGQLALQMMVDALDGKPVEREVRTPFVIATPDNVDSAEVKQFIYKTHCS